MFFKALILFLVSFSSYIAVPVDLNGDWYLKLGRVQPNQIEPLDDWKKESTFPLNIDQIPNKPDQDIISFSLYKSFDIPNYDPNSLSETLSLYIPYATNVVDIYLNSKLIVSSGILNNNSIERNGILTNHIATIPSNLLKPSNNQLLITITGNKSEELSLYGGDLFKIDTLTNNLLTKSERIDLMLLFLYGFVGFYHLLLFAKRPIEKYNLYFGVFCVNLAIYLYSRSNAITELDWDPLNLLRIEYPSLFFCGGFYLFFFEEFLVGKISKISKSMFYYFVVASFLMLVADKTLAAKILKISQIVMIPLLFYSVFLMVRAVLKKHSDAKRLSFGFGILFLCILTDLIGALRLLETWTNHGFVKYGFFTFVIGIAVVLANKFLRIHKQVEELNSSLERKVEERTQQLTNTLNQVQNLKQQQDGDYFLTTLLIKPLMVNSVRSPNVNIEFYIKQKKTFEFKNKIYEIGGDICIANKIKLRGKEYSIFINGDAMGKSIQGAGGALVLGVVFRSVVARTQMEVDSDVMPEVWLKNCFVELHNVFVSFDGSMLISVVLGMVEESNGMLYFINAEHPWTVLYRDAKASFLEDKLLLRKIGMVGMEGHMQVQTFHLQSDDSIIIGSDGRDDILLGMYEGGGRKINEDETIFLQNVEKGKGDLKKITEEIVKLGELTDDYTLLKVNYNPQNVPIDYDVDVHHKFHTKAFEAYEKNNKIEFTTNAIAALALVEKDHSLLRRIIKTYYTNKEFDHTEIWLDKYLNHFPEETDFYITLSYVCKQLSKLEKASDYGEAVRLREPQNVKNLINLADIYRRMNKIPRARKILNEAFHFEPENKKAHDLLNLIEGSKNQHTILDQSNEIQVHL
jgi:tetratricopeptide (TPR) repeat protein